MKKQTKKGTERPQPVFTQFPAVRVPTTGSKLCRPRDHLLLLVHVYLPVVSRRGVATIDEREQLLSLQVVGCNHLWRQHLRCEKTEHAVAHASARVRVDRIVGGGGTTRLGQVIARTPNGKLLLGVDIIRGLAALRSKHLDGATADNAALCIRVPVSIRATANTNANANAVAVAKATIEWESRWTKQKVWLNKPHAKGSAAGCFDTFRCYWFCCCCCCCCCCIFGGKNCIRSRCTCRNHKIGPGCRHDQRLGMQKQPLRGSNELGEEFCAENAT